jgi:ABC-type transport system involved in multi-copper enzyme maturation permease subunit
MIWFTWRQFRTQALTVAAVLLAFLAALALTWAQLTGLARDTGFTGCQADVCKDAADAFLGALSNETAGSLYYVGAGVLFGLPILLGMFWGAPLVARELETGTYRMILSQSVGRRRWLLVKLAVGVTAAALSAGLVSLVLSRWAAPIDQAEGRISPVTFAARGIVPIGFAALAFVIGVIVGMVLRRTVPAMAATLLVVGAVQVLAPGGLMQLLAQPVTSVVAFDPDEKFVYVVDPSTNEMQLDSGVDIPHAWMLSRTTVTSTGAKFSGPADRTRCEAMKLPPSEECRAWLATQNLSVKLTYMPGSSFWALQWRVFGVLITLTLGLSWFSLWWIRRRLT